MTRETKIGLLVGLGFIVVFAVLLSQTTSVPTTGENAPFVSKPGPQLPSLPASRDVVNRPLGPADDRSAPGKGAGRIPDGPAAMPDTDRGLVRLPSPVDSSPKGIDSLGGRLPNPPSLGPSPSLYTGTGGGSTVLIGQTPANHDDADVVASGYVAKKAPSPPGASSVGLASPGSANLVTHVEPAEPLKDAPGAAKPVLVEQPEPGKSPDPGSADPPKEYIVQKGDTLRSIAKQRYDSVSAKVVDFVASSNKDRIKDKNRVFEGQKLVLPDLPADMFEVVQPIDGKKPDLKELARELATVDSRKPLQDAAKPKGESSTPSLTPTGASAAKRGSDSAEVAASPSPRVADYPKLTPRKKGSSPTLAPAPDSTPDPTPDNADDRRAPTMIVKNDEGSLKGKLTLDNGEPKSPRSSDKYRTYEIRDKDTLGSIAARELGTATAWPEIKKLNKDLDPRKMKAGMKIKLPAARPSPSSPGKTSSRPEVNRASA